MAETVDTQPMNPPVQSVFSVSRGNAKNGGRGIGNPTQPISSSKGHKLEPIRVDKK